jgi:hypothetical protein
MLLYLLDLPLCMLARPMSCAMPAQVYKTDDCIPVGWLPYRPAAVRLALLQKLLLSWQPDQHHLQALLDLSLPLLVADRLRLLTNAEAAALHDVAGK